jgi:hypothetical protein
MDIKQIVIGFIVLLAVIWVYRYFFTDPTSSTLLDYGDAKDTATISHTKLSGNAAATDFTYSFWINVDDWNHKLGSKKNIIKRQGNNNDSSPEIYLKRYTNDLVIELAIFDGTGTTGSATSSQIEASTIKNIPLQKWTNITITSNNRSLDTYLDGKLVKTSLLTGPIDVNGSSDITICGSEPGAPVADPGFSGNIAKVRYYSRTLNPREAYELYKEGYSGSLFGNLFNKYKLKFSLITDNKESASLEL